MDIDNRSIINKVVLPNKEIKSKGIREAIKPTFTFWIYKLIDKIRFSLIWRF